MISSPQASRVCRPNPPQKPFTPAKPIPKASQSSPSRTFTLASASTCSTSSCLPACQSWLPSTASIGTLTTPAISRTSTCASSGKPWSVRSPHKIRTSALALAWLNSDWYVPRAGVPFLVGGAYALNYYTGIVRHTKDFDFFVRPEDTERTLEALAAQQGLHTEMTFPHWLGKVYSGDEFCDVIFSSGNGVCRV